MNSSNANGGDAVSKASHIKEEVGSSCSVDV